jgi:hypothetical protein
MTAQSTVDALVGGEQLRRSAVTLLRGDDMCCGPIGCGNDRSDLEVTARQMI